MLQVRRLFSECRRFNISFLQMMGRYKLNQFHFHLSDDEGWRIELECCPELIDVGSRRFIFSINNFEVFFNFKHKLSK